MVSFLPHVIDTNDWDIRTHSRRFCVNPASTFIPSAVPIRAKLSTINPISARSRKPAV
jgi:hypothetical protein